MTADSDIENARYYFTQLETQPAAHDKNIIRHIEQTIRDHLTSAEATIAALDPSGESSDNDMEARLQAAIQYTHLYSARYYFTRLEKQRVAYDEDGMRITKQTIRDHLASAGATIAALDPSGESSDNDMEARLQAAIQYTHLYSARYYFTRLETQRVAYDEDGIRITEQTIRDHLASAGATIAALDPSGESSDNDMEARLQDIWRNISRIRHSSFALGDTLPDVEQPTTPGF